MRKSSLLLAALGLFLAANLCLAQSDHGSAHRHRDLRDQGATGVTVTVILARAPGDEDQGDGGQRRL